MRLHEFIVAHMEPILMDWEDFARKIWPGETPSRPLLRDHAAEMLRAVAADMQDAQSDSQQAGKSTGEDGSTRASRQLDRSSARHAVARAESGFDLQSLVAEYRALRASVLQLWAAHETPDTAFLIDDITRFNEAIDQLLAESVACYNEHVEYSRDIFLGILGHDLRTPLQAVSMVAGVLGSHDELPELARKLAARITTSVREMERMIADLLDFTGTRLGARMIVNRAPTDLAALCREVVEEHRAAHPARDFQIEGPAEAAGEWDRPRVRQLLSNLLGNAVQHGDPAGAVRLSLTPGPGAMRIAVHNHGKPIPSDAIPLIFDPLRRNGGDEATRPHGSIGLGLYIAREVAAAHGGTIHVTSDDTETVFLVSLPHQAAG